MASLLPRAVNQYLLSLEPSNSRVLKEMEAEARRRSFPIIGPQCGRRMAILTMACWIDSVFEMGSGFGYSTVWFASAVGKKGLVVHTEYDPENSEKAQKYLAKAGLASRCRFEVGDAIEILKREKRKFGCILIDIDKHLYPEALKAAVPKLNEGGLIFTHNAVWSGRVANGAADKATRGIRRYNKEIMAHPELASYIDPVDDGLAVSLKVSREQRRLLPL